MCQRSTKPTREKVKGTDGIFGAMAFAVFLLAIVGGILLALLLFALVIKLFIWPCIVGVV